MRTHIAGSVIVGYPNILKACFTQPRLFAIVGLGTNDNHHTFVFFNTINNTILHIKADRIIAFQMAYEKFPNFWYNRDFISENIFQFTLEFRCKLVDVFTCLLGELDRVDSSSHCGSSNTSSKLSNSPSCISRSDSFRASLNPG